MVHIWTKSHMINPSIPKIVVRFGFKSRSSCGPEAPWRWSNTAQILRGGALPFPKRLISSISFALWWWCQVLECLAPKCILLLLLVCVCVSVSKLYHQNTHIHCTNTNGWRLTVMTDKSRFATSLQAKIRVRRSSIIPNPKHSSHKPNKRANQSVPMHLKAWYLLFVSYRLLHI